MDGLLGIGAAGGSTKVNEGDMLQARLASLRAERDLRAQEKQTMTAATPAVAPPLIAQPNQVNSANRTPSPRRNTKSKRKKSKK